MSMESEVKGFEVHARKKGKKQIVFRIWDGKINRYVTKEMKNEGEVAKRLVTLEVERFHEKVIAKAEKRVKNAREDGFESPFATSGELNDPWKEEGKPIIRGI